MQAFRIPARRPLLRVGLQLLLAVLLLRVLVPEGWMPAGNGATITICTPSGAARIAVDADGQPVEAPAEPCPFAAAALAVPPDAPPLALVAPVTLLADAPAWIERRRAASRPAAHGARAPPVLTL